LAVLYTMLLLGMETYAVKYCAALVPPPGPGVATVIGKTPGVAKLDAGTVAVRDVELTKVVGTADPFSSTEEVNTKPVPATLIETALLIGPALTDSDASVGEGGYVIPTCRALETGGLAVGMLTVTLAVPTAVSRLAGTVARRHGEKAFPMRQPA
jgi:hypothetical protein